MCTVLDLPNPLIIPPNYHMPNSVRWVLVPTTWVRHSDPHVAERKMGVPEKWPILAKVQVLPFARAKIQMPPPHTFEGTLAVRFCNSSSHQLGGGEVSVPSAAAVRLPQLCVSLAVLWAPEKGSAQSGAGPQSFSVTLALSWVPRLLFYAGHVV